MFAILPILVHVFPGVSGHSLTNIPLVFCFHQVPDNHRNSKIPIHLILCSWQSFLQHTTAKFVLN